MTSDRRAFLKAAIGGAASISVSLMGASAAFGRSRPDPITANPLGDSLAQISGAGGNVVVLTTADGLVMVDGGLAERSAELLKFVSRSFGGRPVHTLFNTHWHPDHTGSNERLGKAGAKILAHENTKLWLGADFYVEWQDRAYKPQPAAALPNQTFYTSGKVSVGAEEVVYGYLPRAHTDGDIYVLFPRSNVLVAGCLVAVGAYPILDYTTGGWIGGMTDAAKALLGVCDAQTRIVPGVGPVQTRADLQAQYDMLATLKDRLIGSMKKGMGIDDWLADPPTREFDAQWGDPKLFLTNAYHGLWGHVRELGGIV